ncbi:hypothetical protein Pyrde_1363 [Pyrodictium delaneyi]|uniref:Uncharacterized protein n=1 Tax=Pyrodictium delaneyi TaxID=1273541 RepID=A0A0N7JD75_9CREN|nr:hypothetical protein [Pyrodictium delaneyi]ALL01409.1 hypothetical protein Pyrde_1363 [Pyrodictium delaneyi]OWJ54491.1 hypothetical protein Pdsh_06760 [Pyrodictium delaneyi]OWJ54671.1 hypothetical protein Pdsh_06545 [Pyrodictium delaneyi]
MSDTDEPLVEIRVPRSIVDDVQRSIATLLESKRRLTRKEYTLLLEMEGFDTRLLEGLDSGEDDQRVLMAMRGREKRRAQHP